MRSKTAALIVAIVLGLIATVALFIYIGIVTGTANEGRERQSVYTATKSAKKGLSPDQLLQEKIIEKRNVPNKYLPEDVITSLDQVRGQVLDAKLSKGQYLTKTDFKSKKKKGITSFILKPDQVAVSIPISRFASVDGHIKSGDKIILFITSEGLDEGTALLPPGVPIRAGFTRVLLDNVEVISPPLEIDKESGSSSGDGLKLGLTVALSLEDSEKLIFANKTADLWAALQPKDTEITTSTPGATFDNIYN